MSKNIRTSRELFFRLLGIRVDAVQIPDVIELMERWMYEHRRRLTVPLVTRVGAAFDFIAGTVKQSPAWMQENGLG